MIPPTPVLDEDTARLARIYGKDRDSAGVLISRLMAHIDRLDVHVKTLSALANQAESMRAEAAREQSVCASPRPGVWTAGASMPVGWTA